MAANDIFGAPDPTKLKKPVDPNAQGGDIFGGAQPAPQQFSDKAVPGPTFTAQPPQFGDKAVPGPTFSAPAAAPAAPAAPAVPAPAPAGGEMTPQQASAAGLGWVDKNNPNYGKAGFVGSAQGAPLAPGAPAVPGAPVAAPVDVPGHYQSALLKMLDSAATPASLNDPALKAQSDAFSVGQARAQERGRADAAERAAAQGLSSSGALDQAIASGNESRGQAESGFNAGLVGDAAKQKLTQLTAALSMMGNDINSDKGRALQKAIADTQAQIQREGIQQQGALGSQDIQLRDKLGTGSLNAQIAQMLQQNQQFGQGLGAQIGMNTAGLNQQAILQMLAGL